MTTYVLDTGIATSHPDLEGRATNVFDAFGGNGQDCGRASFSNYGAYVDTYAPDVGVLSASLSGGTTSMSGTSMAAPHGAGAVALYKSARGEATSATVHARVVGTATPGLVAANPGSTANRLLYLGGL